MPALGTIIYAAVSMLWIMYIPYIYVKYRIKPCLNFFSYSAWFFNYTCIISFSAYAELVYFHIFFIYSCFLLYHWSSTTFCIATLYIFQYNLDWKEKFQLFLPCFGSKVSATLLHWFLIHYLMKKILKWNELYILLFITTQIAYHIHFQKTFSIIKHYTICSCFEP